MARSGSPAWIVLALCCALLSGCGKQEGVAQQPTKDRFAKWPADTLPRPEFLGVVERQAGFVKGDAEPARVPSTYQLPDWAEPTSTISAKGPKGASLTYHLLPRPESLRKQDDERIANLLAGEKTSAETLVIARPWIGWYGQAGGANALRVYNLFANNQLLEIHLEWPTGDKEAFEEGQMLLSHLVYSLKPMRQAATP